MYSVELKSSDAHRWVGGLTLAQALEIYHTYVDEVRIMGGQRACRVIRAADSDDETLVLALEYN